VAGMCTNITQIDADIQFQCSRLKVLQYGDSTWVCLREGKNLSTESLGFRIDLRQHFKLTVPLKKEQAVNFSGRDLNFSNLELSVPL
jgi:hypothetical protein